MKKLSSLLSFIALSLVLFSCNNSDLESRINGLEKRVADLEAPKVKPELTLAQNQIENVETAEEVPSGPAPKFKFEHEEFDFGTIKEGVVVSHTFKFTNVGEAPLIIQNASATCGCTVPDWTKSPIPVGGTGEVQVKYDSKNKSGVENKIVTITANTVPADTKLSIKTVVTPKAGEAQAEGPVKK
ncbi:MAG: DUF1573 domain-containing protein [Bacteroidota bacterium]|nr:DUF1573 domain-containing protein [Bacteroidota bacterium]